MVEIFDDVSDPAGEPEVITGNDLGYSLTRLREQSVVIRAQEEAQRKILEDHEASIFTSIGGAFRFDTGTGVAGTYIKDKVQYDADETFNPAEDMKIDSWEFPENRVWEQEVLKGAKSEAHYEMLKGRIKDRREYLLNMQDMGVVPSLGLQLVAEFANIPNYFTFGLGGLAKVGKLKRFLTAGVVTGSANVAEEAFINTMYKDKTATDYIAAGALGMGLGWLGTFGRVKGDAKTALHIETTGNRFADFHVRNAVQERSYEFYNGKAKEVDEYERILNVLRTGESTVGSQQIPNIHRAFGADFDPELTTPRMNEDNPIVQQTFAALLAGDLPKAAKLLHENIGLASLSQSLHSSENPIARHMVAELLEHPEGVGRWNKHTAAIEADLDFVQFTATYAPEYLRLKAAWKVLAEQNPEIKHNFDEAASVWIEGSGSIAGSNRQMDDLLHEFNGLYNKMNESTYRIMKDSGVLEAAEEGLDPNHLGRNWDGEKFQKARDEHGDSVVLETLQESILEGNDFRSMHTKADKEFLDELKLEQEGYDFKVKRAQEELDALKAKVDSDDVSTKGLRDSAKVEKAQRKLDRVKKDKPDVTRKPPKVEETALRMAQALYNRFLNRATVSTADANLLSSANRALLTDALDDLKLAPADRLHIDRILETAGKDHKTQPFKHQMGMKIGHQNAKSGLRVLDFMHTDLGSAYSSKQRYWLGRAAAAKHGFDSEVSFQQAVDQLKRHGSDRGQDIKEITADVKRLEAGWRMIMGQPIEDMSAPGIAAMRVVRKAMAASALGKLGMVQAGETGRVAAAVGIKNMFQMIPMMRDMVADIKDGRLDTATLMDIEEYVFGKIGDQHYMNHPDFRADDFGHRVSRAEAQLDRASYWLSKASGWHLVHTQQKKFLMNGLAQKWHRELSSGAMPVTQMKDLGVPIEHIEGLQRMMKTHATPIEGTNAVNLNLGNWEPQLRRTFALMLHRKGNNAVQDIVAGETPLWINHGIGKFIGQFRTFSLAALGKQTVHDWRMHKEGDQEAALAFQFMLATSTMAVTSRMAFDAAALPEKERKKYLRNNMTVAGITNRVLNYHGQASPIVDMTNLIAGAVIPNTWGQLTGNSMYRNGRGMSSKVPGISYIDRATKGITGVAKGVLPGESMSKSDWKAFVGVMPLSSWYGFHALNKRVVTPLLFDK